VISQSTIGENSSKIPADTNPSNQVPQGSRTTDDLLQLSMGTAETNLFPSKESIIVVGGRNNSTIVVDRSTNINDQFHSNSVRKKNLKGLLGDYNSQTLLPKVRDSLSIAAKSHFKKNDPY